MSQAAASEGKRPTLAIVSSYTKYCGIAAYTRRLAEYLQGAFEVEVVPLDQLLCRARTPRQMELAEKHIDEVAEQVAKFDMVNVQWEPGTFGPTAAIACKRLARVVRASKSLSMTMHTFEAYGGFPWLDLWWGVSHLKPQRVIDVIKDARRRSWLSKKPMNLLRSAGRSKRVSIITHTQREARSIRLDYRMDNVFDHPLSFLRECDVEQAYKSEPLRPSSLPEGEDLKFVGVFGFISRYKGTITAVRAMSLLPSNYHLLIFGGVHPAGIAPFEEVDTYLDQVIRRIEGRGEDADASSGSSKRKAKEPKLTKRVHFMGALGDEDFFAGMAGCDVVVLPYLEVNQTSSGPVSIANELGKRLLVSRNHAFMEYAKYHPERFEFFDIGNHVELAQQILRPVAGPASFPAINYQTNTDVYRRAHGI